MKEERNRKWRCKRNEAARRECTGKPCSSFFMKEEKKTGGARPIFTTSRLAYQLRRTVARNRSIPMVGDQCGSLNEKNGILSVLSRYQNRSLHRIIEIQRDSGEKSRRRIERRRDLTMTPGKRKCNSLTMTRMRQLLWKGNKTHGRQSCDETSPRTCMNNMARKQTQIKE